MMRKEKVEGSRLEIQMETVRRCGRMGMTVAEIAMYLGISVWSLERLVRTKTRKTVAKYLIPMRIGKKLDLKELLWRQANSSNLNGEPTSQACAQARYLADNELGYSTRTDVSQNIKSEVTVNDKTFKDLTDEQKAKIADILDGVDTKSE